MISGKLRNSNKQQMYNAMQCNHILLFSLAHEMRKKAQELNITYHPILDNFLEFDDLPRTVFNESLKFYFAASITTG